MTAGRPLFPRPELPASARNDLIRIPSIVSTIDGKRNGQHDLRKGGYFVVSHSESLHGIAEALEMVMPSVYLKP